jgi:hypothetical protein
VRHDLFDVSSATLALMSSGPRFMALLVLAGAFAIAALVTMWPYSAATKTNDLGFLSLCPFAPWSALVLLAGAGLVLVIRAYRMRPQK